PWCGSSGDDLSKIDDCHRPRSRFQRTYIAEMRDLPGRSDSTLSLEMIEQAALIVLQGQGQWPGMRMATRTEHRHDSP
ncbi:hypothetical protein, partial [Corallococcus exiguus]|uniref:hypothetical protein n=1 Tax=Corallococcus exiguus TaxID=83462 RepID=UPI001B8AEA7D